MFFIVDKNQVCRRRLGDARDSADFHRAISYELRLYRFGDRTERALHGIFVYVWRRKEKLIRAWQGPKFMNHEGHEVARRYDS